jgi:hypothetical protein
MLLTTVYIIIGEMNKPGSFNHRHSSRHNNTASRTASRRHLQFIEMERCDELSMTRQLMHLPGTNP